MTTMTTNTINIGDGATISTWSDSKPATVVRVSPTGKTIWVQEDDAVLLNGWNSGEPDALKVYPGGFCAHVSGVQRYSYSRNADNQIRKATKRKDGTFRLVGHTTSGAVNIGSRFKHYDYNF